MLPKGKISTRTVELSGGTVEVHSLTVAQSRIASKIQDEMDSMVAAISFATGTPKQDVEAWVDEAPAGDARLLMEAIYEVSSLTGAAQFRE